ncbi:antitoxin MazE family protein [Nocardia anaemiae]|uniref:antitoxin MazE family protein n=1 Tax=Nocardia anaemiae TaxID=263910 RepID=UPI0007A559B2|nr:antitoxin MazE family protein [Nocardia anaemiae]
MAAKDRVQAHRDRLREQGLRPIQIWVPDTRSPQFLDEAHRQSVLLADNPYEHEDQAFVDAISYPLDDE